MDYQLNKNYIAENLCENKNKPAQNCNGKCHLKKELQKDEKKQRNPLSIKDKFEIQLFSETQYELSVSSFLICKQEFEPYQSSLNSSYISSFFHPPSF